MCFSLSFFLSLNKLNSFQYSEMALNKAYYILGLIMLLILHLEDVKGEFPGQIMSHVLLISVIFLFSKHDYVALD